MIVKTHTAMANVFTIADFIILSRSTLLSKIVALLIIWDLVLSL
jgi:hypothetical protein